MIMRRKMVIVLLVCMLCTTGCSKAEAVSDTDSEAVVQSTEIEIETETESMTSIDSTDIDKMAANLRLDILNSSQASEKQQPLYTFEDEDLIMYATTSLNIRNLPSTDGMKIGSYAKNNMVQVNGVCNETGWLRVIWNDSVGYVSSTFVSDEHTIEEVKEPEQPAASDVADEIEPAVPQLVEPDIGTVSSTFVQGEAGVSSSMVSGVESYYNKLPENVRQYFQQSGWKITVSGTSLGPRWGYSYSILALTVYGDKQIWIDNRNEAKSSIVHETGHFIDYTQGFTSSSQTFSDIYSAEMVGFCAYHKTHVNNTNTAMEYFAEAFQQCVYDPSGMATACPQTYNYIMNIVNSL